MKEHLLVVDKENHDQPISVIMFSFPHLVHLSELATNKQTKSVFKEKTTSVIESHFDAKIKIKTINYDSNDYSIDIKGKIYNDDSDEFHVQLIPIDVV